MTFDLRMLLTLAVIVCAFAAVGCVTSECVSRCGYARSECIDQAPGEPRCFDGYDKCVEACGQ